MLLLRPIETPGSKGAKGDSPSRLAKVGEKVYGVCMLLARGKVVQGKVVVDGPALDEGAEVVVLAREADEDAVELTPEQRAELLESIGQADRGETVEGFALLDELRRKHP